MGSYAKHTEVSSEKSKMEIETLLRKHKADQFISGWQDGIAAVGFRMNGRMIRFKVPMPRPEEFKKDRNGWTRSPDQIAKVVAQEERQRWRALLLVIKAKLEAVESKISLFEDEFLAHIVLPNNETVGEFIKPQLEEAYSRGKMPLQLGFDGGRQ